MCNREIERPLRESSLSVCVFAVDDLGLVRMQSQPAFRQPLFKRQTQLLRLCFASTMADSIICVNVRTARPDIPGASRDRTRSERKRFANTGLTTAPCGVPFSRWINCPSGMQTGALSQTLKVEEHPFAIRVSPHGPHQEFPIDVIEKALDVEIEHPVIVPASLPGHAEGIVCRFLRPISIGVLVELRLQDRLQKRLTTIWRFCRRPLEYLTAESLRYHLFGMSNAAHGRRKVAAGTHPIPDPIEIIFSNPFQSPRSIVPSTPAAPLLAFTCLYASHTSRFRYTKCLASFMSVLPLRVAHTLKPDDDAPSVQSHYKTFNPITGVSAPVPRIDTLTLMAAGHLGFSLHRDDRFLRSLSKPVSCSRRLHAGRRLGNKQAPPNPCSQDRSQILVSTSLFSYDTSSAVHSRSSS